MDEKDKPDSSSPNPDSHRNNVGCLVCGSLPDDLTVNTGREEHFPGAYRQLIGMDRNHRSEFLRCPGCQTYFNWIDMSQMYGSGNNDEERLVRLSPTKSRLLDKLFSSDVNYLPEPAEVEEYIRDIPLDMLLPALSFRMHRNPEVVARFVPQLLPLLGKNNDSSLWELLKGYVSDNPKRAEEILEAFRSSGKDAPTRLIQLLQHCLRVVEKKK